MVDLSNARAACRVVADQEVALYKQQGWAKLDRLISPEMVDTLRRVGHQKMGPNGDDNAPLAGPGLEYFNPEPGGALENGALRPMVELLAESARALMGRKPSIGVRY